MDTNTKPEEGAAPMKKWWNCKLEPDLQGKAKRCAKRRGVFVSTWIREAIEEKARRERKK